MISSESDQQLLKFLWTLAFLVFAGTGMMLTVEESAFLFRGLNNWHSIGLDTIVDVPATHGTSSRFPSSARRQNNYVA